MKKFFVLLLLVTAISCGSEEDCTILSDQLVGTWESASLGDGTIEFREDGTFIDDNELLLEVTVNGVTFDEKTWTVEENSRLILEARNGSQFLNLELNVPTFDCDVISLEQLGVMVDLTRN